MARIQYDGKDNVTVTGRNLILAAFVVVALAVIIFGGWQLGWWFRAQNVNRSAAINRSSLAFQQAKVDEITRKQADLKTLQATASTTQDADQKAQLDAQAAAITSIICADYAQVTPSYRDTLDPSTVAKLNVLCP